MKCASVISKNIKKRLAVVLVYQNLSWKIQSDGQLNVSESTKVHIVTLLHNHFLLKTDLLWSSDLQGASYLPTQKKAMKQTRISSDLHPMELYQTGEFTLVLRNCSRVTVGKLTAHHSCRGDRQVASPSHGTVRQSVTFTPSGNLIKSTVNLSCIFFPLGKKIKPLGL